MNNIAEIKVSYSSRRKNRIKIKNSNQVYELALKNWDLASIEFREIVKVIYLNRANDVLGLFELSIGGVASSVIDIKILLSVALKAHASALILIHNHPSGNLKPSQSDLDITQKVKQACKHLELSLLDHLIISKHGYYSIADELLI